MSLEGVVLSIVLLVLFVALCSHLASGAPSREFARKMLLHNYRDAIKQLKGGSREPRLCAEFVLMSVEEDVQRALTPAEHVEATKCLEIAQNVMRYHGYWA